MDLGLRGIATARVSSPISFQALQALDVIAESISRVLTVCMKVLVKSLQGTWYFTPRDRSDCCFRTAKPFVAAAIVPFVLSSALHF